MPTRTASAMWPAWSFPIIDWKERSTSPILKPTEDAMFLLDMPHTRQAKTRSSSGSSVSIKRIELGQSSSRVSLRSLPFMTATVPFEARLAKHSSGLGRAFHQTAPSGPATVRKPRRASPEPAPRTTTFARRVMFRPLVLWLTPSPPPHHGASVAPRRREGARPARGPRR